MRGEQMEGWHLSSPFHRAILTSGILMLKYHAVEVSGLGVFLLFFTRSLCVCVFVVGGESLW